MQPLQTQSCLFFYTTGLFLKIRTILATLRTEAAFISRWMGTSVTTDFLSLTGNTEPAWVIGIPRTNSFLIIRVFFNLLGNGSPVFSQYFRVKYTSSQEYCTRIYRDTSTTCNEYASRKSYKEKLFSHPIHTEFTKSYNRLYARIRRGKLPADTPLMDQLKALHDEYTEKYENTHQKDREAVWKEYIEKNKELLN